MLQTIIKKSQAKKIESSYTSINFADAFTKVKNKSVEQFAHFKETYKETMEQKLHILQKIDGISIWKINSKLNRLAVRGISNEVLKKGILTIPLPAKQSSEPISSLQKTFIEKTIDELEGFENLRLSHFYNYKPTYIEKKTLTEITRWIEIEISDL